MTQLADSQHAQELQTTEETIAFIRRRHREIEQAKRDRDRLHAEWQKSNELLQRLNNSLAAAEKKLMEMLKFSSYRE